MKKDFIAIAGLPRAGSNLITHIMDQNPIFTISLDSKLSPFLNEQRIFVRDNIKFNQLPHQDYENLSINFCRAGTKSWIDTVCTSNILLDKNRVWFHQYHFFFKLFPKMKMIICLRDLRFVLNSCLRRMQESMAMEFRNNFYSNFQENFLKQQIDKLLIDPFIHEGLLSLKEIIDVNQNYKSQLYFLKYENLIENKNKEINKIYDFLELDRFSHDLQNIKVEEFHNDNFYQPIGDHYIRSSIADKLDYSLEYLNQELANYIFYNYKWYYDYFYPEISLTTENVIYNN